MDDRKGMHQLTPREIVSDQRLRLFHSHHRMCDGMLQYPATETTSVGAIQDVIEHTIA
jgi:hypothetical protein